MGVGVVKEAVLINVSWHEWMVPVHPVKNLQALKVPADTQKWAVLAGEKLK